MNKYILFFIYLVSTSLSSYLPLKKDNGFDDNVCAYYFKDVNYVKTCKDKGKYCKNIGEATSFCEDAPTTITLKTLDDKCDSTYECEDGLYCYSGQCTMYPNTIVNCGNNEVAIKTTNGWICKDKAVENYCYYRDNNNYSGGTPNTYENPNFFKVCGEITFEPTTLPNNDGTKYSRLTIETAYIGTVEDGKFVQDPLACKSGYALPFYPNSSLKDPSSTGVNKMFLKCVKVNGIDYDNSLTDKCVIKYDNDLIYNIGQLNTVVYPDFRASDFCEQNLMTKLEIFSKYINVFTKEKQEKCATKDNYNEIYTCNDNELRKWYYYYKNPSHYTLYYKEKGNDVANYLIQQAFPLYESSKYLQIKYLIILLFLFLF